MVGDGLSGTEEVFSVKDLLRTGGLGATLAYKPRNDRKLEFDSH